MISGMESFIEGVLGSLGNGAVLLAQFFCAGPGLTGLGFMGVGCRVWGLGVYGFMGLGV